MGISREMRKQVFEHPDAGEYVIPLISIKDCEMDIWEGPLGQRVKTDQTKEGLRFTFKTEDGKFCSKAVTKSMKNNSWVYKFLTDCYGKKIKKALTMSAKGYVSFDDTDYYFDLIENLQGKLFEVTVEKSKNSDFTYITDISPTDEITIPSREELAAKRPVEDAPDSTQEFENYPNKSDDPEDIKGVLDKQFGESEDDSEDVPEWLEKAGKEPNV